MEALNSRIIFNRLSSRQILYQHDQFSEKQLVLQDDTLSSQMECLREKGHYPTALSKSKGVHQHQSIHVLLVIYFILNLKETSITLETFN